jgi:hypothetical protein
MNLEGYYRIMSALQEYGISLIETENMMPWEREIMTILITERLQRKEQANVQ